MLNPKNSRHLRKDRHSFGPRGGANEEGLYLGHYRVVRETRLTLRRDFAVPGQQPANAAFQHYFVA